MALLIFFLAILVLGFVAGAVGWMITSHPPTPAVGIITGLATMFPAILATAFLSSSNSYLWPTVGSLGTIPGALIVWRGFQVKDKRRNNIAAVLTCAATLTLIAVAIIYREPLFVTLARFIPMPPIL